MLNSLSSESTSWQYQKSSKRRRSVSQDGQLYLEQESEIPSRNGPYLTRSISAYDGEWTRNVQRTNQQEANTFAVRRSLGIAGTDGLGPARPSALDVDFHR